MNKESDIKNKLKDAIKTSCYEAFYFSDSETQLIEAEYLLTVNSAKAVRELNSSFGFPCKIRLEHDTGKFSTACTPLTSKIPADNFLDHKSVTRTKSNSNRPGKIDIALYTSNNGIDTPLCPIEIKGFNPVQKYIVKDLERNAEYFGISSPTGTSTLSFALFVALHSYKGVWSDEKEKKNIEKLKKRYQNYIDQNSNLQRMHHDVEVFTVRRGVMPDPDDSFIQEFGLQGDEDYHFVGVIVTTKKKQQ